MRKPAVSIKAFSLIEVTLALGVAGFCLVAIFGLLPVGLNSTQAALEQTAANNVLAAVAADLRATSPTKPRGAATTSGQFKITIPKNGESGTATLYFAGEGGFSATLQPQSRYLVTVAFQTSTGGKMATLADVKVSWPAQAALANATGFIETFVALDRN